MAHQDEPRKPTLGEQAAKVIAERDAQRAATDEELTTDQETRDRDRYRDESVARWLPITTDEELAAEIGRRGTARFRAIVDPDAFSAVQTLRKRLDLAERAQLLQDEIIEQLRTKLATAEAKADLPVADDLREVRDEWAKTVEELRAAVEKRNETIKDLRAAQAKADLPVADEEEARQRVADLLARQAAWEAENLPPEPAAEDARKNRNKWEVIDITDEDEKAAREAHAAGGWEPDERAAENPTPVPPWLLGVYSGHLTVNAAWRHDYAVEVTLSGPMNTVEAVMNAAIESLREETEKMTDPRITAALDYLTDPEFLEAPDGTVSKAAYDVTATLVAVLREVAEIHAPVESPSGRQVCAGCGTHVTFTPYPCDTARALAPLAELGAER